MRWTTYVVVDDNNDIRRSQMTSRVRFESSGYGTDDRLGLRSAYSSLVSSPLTYAAARATVKT
uniref:Uncharacterized protein n=1 Tax=Romanomermis culicivorax TaxID=13658 RepID=A0A915KZA3_ROMCU